MSGQHGEWLSLIEISGPFLAEPVLKEAFPQGLEGLEPEKKTTVRQAYDEWREALDHDDPDLSKIHRAWIDLILGQILELDENGDAEILKPTAQLPETLRCDLPEHGITLRPDYAVMDGATDNRPLILIAVYDPEVSLSESFSGDGWPASPAERMVELCRATNVRLGLVTNGEQWMFVDAPVGAVTTFASWYARHWGQEPVTLQAFVNLFGIRRFFVDRSEQLPALLDNSLKFQDEVTDALGEQVRRAVEVLIQALDRADVDRNRELLEGIEPTELYESGLTVMMRIVFLLSAEERGLLLLGDARYEANYAVSTLRMQLRGESEEILERRWDAWSRLLSIFRAVYGGVEHEAMRLPALGGSLFDPDRFPFLEGRKKGTRWKTDAATPLPIDNRTVLYLLDSVQLFRGRALSYLALDIEQIGYVYEGLLERTVVRAKEATLDLDATKNAENPWVALSELDDAAAESREAVEKLLRERTGSSASRIRNDLDEAVDEASADKLLSACHADRSLRDRVRPYFHLLRTDRWGYPLLYHKGAFMVRSGGERRETGTHYTPKSLTEMLVKTALEPLVYFGPAQGKPRKDWELKSPAELLDLKICDLAMGSGAFLVQACRWLSERLVESWEQCQAVGRGVTSEGAVVEAYGAYEPLRKGVEERLVTARRLIAEKCLYGVDINPLAVELSKLSIWLVTLAKNRPFGFLDHNLRHGDSLLGIHNLEQLYYLELHPGADTSKKLFAQKIDVAVAEAIQLRSDLRNRPIRDIHDVEVMANLDERARRELAIPEIVADAVIGRVLAANGKQADMTALSVEAGDAISGEPDDVARLRRYARQNLDSSLPLGKRESRPFHWRLEFPEVFSRVSGGFDAIVSNPPYLGGRKIRGILGEPYLNYLTCSLFPGTSGNADLCAFFLRRASSLIRCSGILGVVASSSISEGDTREVGLQSLIASGSSIIRAASKSPWPGNASVTISPIWIFNGTWNGNRRLNDKDVSEINSYLSESSGSNITPFKLKVNSELSFQGSIPLGTGFVLTQEETESLLARDRRNADVICPYLVGQELNIHPTHQPSRWIINFYDWPLDHSSSPAGYAGPVASDYPDCLDIIRERVFPERTRRKANGDFALRKPLPQKWWIYGDKRPKLYSKLKSIKWSLAIATQATKYVAFGRVSGNTVYSHSIVIVPSDDPGLAGVLASSIHEAWARKYGSYNLLLLRYSPSDIFDTFVLPPRGMNLRDVGNRYYETRDQLMRRCGEGLTRTYNRFHDPTDVSQDIQQLRVQHVQLDHEVSKSYGWSEIELEHGFYQTEQGIRYTISDDSRKIVLNNLLELNHKQFEKEKSVGQA